MSTKNNICFNSMLGFLKLLNCVAVGLVLWLNGLELSRAADPDTKRGALSGADWIKRGQGIYLSKCASCHGSKGEGVSGAYAEPLVGDFAISELSKLIHDTMPEGEPESCVGEDAEAVARFIYDDFYGPAAQVRNRPPRASLARLTGNQLRQSLADLYAHFATIAEPKQERGVKGLYFDGDRFKKEKQKIDRIDPTIDFDFGRESPGEEIKPESFYIYWEGSLKPEKSGRYEIIVRSTCSFKMDFGKIERLFIDNHVQSGDKTEFRESIYLTAGRVYPFKIDFVQRKRKTELPPAKISLSWITPGGMEETIPTQYLIPSVGPGVFSLQTALPPDDRTYGFERGIAVNRQWDESTTQSAIEFSNIVAKELFPRYQRKNKEVSNENRGQLKSFLKELLEVAFRGPMDTESEDRFIEKSLASIEDDGDAIRTVVLMGLKSPRFLYPLVDADRSRSQKVANRLCLFMFDSLPSDEWILRAVKKGQLETKDQIRNAAKRLANDYRFQAKQREMIHEWLGLNKFQDLSKDETKFGGFDEALAADLRKSLEAFIDEILTSDACDFRQLLSSRRSYTTPKIAAFYGDVWKPEEEGAKSLSKTVASLTNEFSVLTHPFLMSGLAYHDNTSPIHRGVFLIRNILGRSLRPPSDAFSPLSPDLHPDLSTRERVFLQTSPDSCQTCHSKINALGFALESFDAAGRMQQHERGKPIDASGSYRTRSDELVQFADSKDLVRFLAEAPDAHRAFVNRAFQFMVKQPAEAFGPKTLESLIKKFSDNGYNMRELMIEISIVAASPLETIDSTQERN